MSDVMKKGLFIVISGPSGVGKGTICRELLDKIDVNYSVSMTTRSMREGEVDGVDYYFTTKDDFEKRINNNEFIEYAKYNDNYYGTLKSEVEDKLNNGKNIICEIEVQGAMQIKKLFPDSVLICILPPSIEELENRLIKRNTNDKDDIKKRIEIAKKELEFADEYDFRVVNDDVDRAVDEIMEILASIKS